MPFFFKMRVFSQYGIRERKLTDKEEPKTEEAEVPVVPANAYAYADEERRLYEKLCRGGTQPSPKILARLRCSYFDNGNPYLRIGPVKVEEAYPKPRILVFHDVIYDDEIAVIKALATPRVNAVFVVLELDHKRS